MNPRELTKLGLTEGEAKVYLALSELGSTTVGPLVKKSRVAYSNIYEILDRLLKKGIVSYIMKSKTKYFAAATPKNLYDYLDKKENEILDQKKSLKKIIPKLEEIRTPSKKYSAEIFVGLKGLRTAYEKFLSGGKDFIFFYIHKKEYEEKSDLFYFSLFDKMAKMNTIGITNTYSKKSPWFKKAKKLMKIKFVDFPFPANLEICGDYVLLVSWEKEVSATLIHSEDLSSNMREYFNSIWKIAKP